MGYQSLLDLDRRRYPDATKLAGRAVQIEKKMGGDSNPQLSAGLLVLGLANLLAGEPRTAEPPFRQALNLRQHSFPPGHPELLLAQVRLAEALLAEHRPQEALNLLTPVVAAAKAAPFPQPSWRDAELHLVYGLAMRGTGHEKEAAALIAENSTDLQGYDLAAVKSYLMRSIAR